MRAVLSLSLLCVTLAVEKKRSDTYIGAVLEYHPVDSDQFQTAAEVSQTKQCNDGSVECLLRSNIVTEGVGSECWELLGLHRGGGDLLD